MVEKKDLHEDSGTPATGDDVAPIAETASTATPNYTVGYGKPPKKSRWKPGQSGNPKGKKKGMKSVKELFLGAAKKKVTVKDAKGVKEVSQIEAVVALLFRQAMKGDPKANAQIMALAKEFLPLPAPETAQEAIDKLHEAAKAVPGAFAILPEQIEALEGMKRLYGAGSDRGKGPKG
jgi:hypothetical protein